MVYGFAREVFKVFYFIPKTADEVAWLPTPDEWLAFVSHHPEELWQVTLAAAICGLALYRLARLSVDRRATLL